MTHAAKPQHSMYDIFAVCFVAFLLLSNIGATKLIALGPLVFDGGAILFPLTYIIGDVLSEVYGFAKARRAIVLGFIIALLASIVFWLIILAPAHESYTDQAAFEAVLGVVPRFVAASLLGYLCGQILNSWVLVKIKARFGENRLWVRLIGSTVAGEFVDSVIFCVVAWIGVSTAATIANLTVVGFLYKVGVEVVLLPLTYAVIRWVKAHEITYKTAGKK
ncbi:queuosine precursor transporter [Arcanobacterium sp. S3PF19]|uniref:queuosine precursor transporter n=1 Tax=Arcanobacterium sp. S3PF19 TaxID=1219585 RepID=UPI00051032E0|nr:queuosine precursor transporter [Arcanobacterium sp. S3PF19]KGF05844.1 membrane protein [Arcanobacterium sp. S3PF19]